MYDLALGLLCKWSRIPLVSIFIISLKDIWFIAAVLLAKFIYDTTEVINHNTPLNASILSHEKLIYFNREVLLVCYSIYVLISWIGLTWWNDSTSRMLDVSGDLTGLSTSIKKCSEFIFCCCRHPFALNQF